MRSEVYASSITVGELYFGADKSYRIASNLERIRGLVEQFTVLACDVETADYYDQVKHDLRARGRPIPENDSWIADLLLPMQCDGERIQETTIPKPSVDL